MSDSALSPDSLGSLYRDHQPWLLSWFRRRLNGAEQAADLAQDTFVRVLSRRQAIDLREPRAWLRTIAGGLLIDHWRRHELERAWLEALAALPEPLAMSAEDQHLILELLEAVCRMVDTLRAPVRQAFLLYRVEGLKQGEIAERMGVTLRSVERYLTEATMRCYELRYGRD